MEEKVETVEQPPVKKRMGRPPGTKNKTKKASKVRQTPFAAFEKLQKAHDKLKDEHLLHRRTANTACNALNNVIADLKHEIVGYQAVISYLENQLGLKKSI